MAASSDWKPYEIPPDLAAKGFLVGTSGYYYDDWVGLFNPPRYRRAGNEEESPDQDRLRYYQKYFTVVEINSTFYHEPTLPSFLDITERSLERTRYVVKVHQTISHSKQFDVQSASESLERHITAVSPLIETGRFFSFLIQLEDHLQRSQKRLEYLMAVSAVALRKEIDVHIEFRHVSWHDRNVLQTLKDNGVGVCNTEIPPVKHAFPLKAYATTNKGYIRFSGRNIENWYPATRPESAKEKIDARNARYNYCYSEQEIKERVVLSMQLKKKTTEVVIAFNNHYQTKAVLNAIQCLKLLAEKIKAFKEGFTA